jgi:hypothetical protein
MVVTIQAVDAYHLLRNNTAWAGLSPTQKNAAMARAEDYIIATYFPLISTVEDDDTRLVAAFALLALEFRTSTPALKTEQLIKSDEITSGDKSSKVTYQDADKAPVTDPYPFVTAMISPLQVKQSAGGVSFGQMV